MRPSGRALDEAREIKLTTGYTKHAEGSVLVEFGDTKVICTASVDESVPRFLKGAGKGWITAEYGMLPRSTGSRMAREAAKGKQGGRTVEIQRLIGRSLRAAVDLEKLGERTITIDCDVIQADGGTRTASITGGCVALGLALNSLIEKGKLISLFRRPWRLYRLFYIPAYSIASNIFSTMDTITSWTSMFDLITLPVLKSSAILYKNHSRLYLNRF